MRQIFLVFLMLVVLGGVFSAQAAGVVGTGTPASCTEAAFDAALAGGGTINFNCGAAAHTIFLGGPKTISANTNIEGDGLITFDGGGFTNLFYVMSGVELVIRDATLQNGRSINGGAIVNDQGRLSLIEVKFRRNEVVRADPTSITGLGGAIYNARGEVSINGGDFRGNRADRWGGAILGTFFLGNTVNASGDDGGAISNGGGGLAGGDITITDARFGLNTAPLSGGAIYGANGGTTRITGTNFVWNLANVGGAISIVPPTDARTVAGLTVFQSRFLTNVARYYGGAINSGVATTITQADFETNSARGGGALQLYGTAEIYVTDTSFERNRATYDHGGAILNTASDLRVLNSLFVRNLARQHGGGIFNNQLTTSGYNLRVVNTTFSYNRALGQGGGLFNTAGSFSVWLRFVTMAYNQAPIGANIRSPGMRVQSSIIAHPVGGTNCSVTIPDISWVIQFGDTSCSTGVVTADPLIAPLADNGGFTWTHAIPAESPAVDGSLCPTFAEGIDTDQRDFPRPGSGTGGSYACDIGAYEYQDLESASFPLTAQTVTPMPTLPLVPTQVSVNCQPFRLTSPRDGLPNGGITVYWDPAPGAAGYRVIVYNENNAAVASADAPANTTSLNLDVSEGAVGGGFTFTLEVQALLNGQSVCRDAATMLRSAPPPQQQCGNGIQEPGETPNTCPNGY